VPWLKQTIGHLAEGDELPGGDVSDVDCTEKQLCKTLQDVCIGHHGAREQNSVNLRRNKTWSFPGSQ
jgi:hypothetical protein